MTSSSIRPFTDITAHPFHSWSFVTFQAALAFLLSDPLDALSDEPLPPPVLFVPFPASPSKLKRSSDSPAPRTRRSSIHQRSPYATADQRRSPPSSPRSIRTISSTWSGTPSGPVESTAKESCPPQTSRHQRRGGGSVSPGRRSVRSSSTDRDEMPPPSWTSSTRHARRRSLGVLPVSSPLATSRTSVDEFPGTTIASSMSMQGDLRIRPRIVLAHSSTSYRGDKDDASPRKACVAQPPLVRSQSSISVSRQIGSAERNSTDMCRTGSEDSPTVRRSFHEVWTLWGAGTNTGERAVSPALSDGTTFESGSGEDRSWWDWGRERLNSVGPGLALTRTQSGTSTPRTSMPLSQESQETGAHSVLPSTLRGRRYSASAVDSVTPSDQSSSARLAAVLAARNGGLSRPRPRSIMSVSSASSMDSGTGYNTAAESLLASSIGSLNSHHVQRHKITKSRTWRELPISNSVTKPLE